jgi:hypothetical protein
VTVNELLVARVLSPDGVLEPAMTWSVRYTQAALAICGVALLLKRHALITVLIIAGSALNLVVFQQKARAVIAGGSVAEGRLLELRRLLPASGRVGYVTDELPWSSNEATERYYLTQYAVAPVVVVPEPNQEWVIGNFHDVRSASAPRDMHVARDFGGGLILFRKNGPWPH